MAETPKQIQDLKVRAPRRGLDERELRDRQDDLDKALKLYAGISGKLSQALPLMEQAMGEAAKLQHMCDQNPALRAAMVARRLSIASVGQDIRHVYFKASTISKSVDKNVQSRGEELAETMRDPELLR